MFLALGTGGRDWEDVEQVHFEYDKLLQEQQMMICIQGGCKTGADLMIRQWCVFNEIPCLNWPSRWNFGGERGREGPKRNWAMCNWVSHQLSLLDAVDMVDRHQMHKVLAFWDGKSSGTKSCIEEALKFQLNLEVFGPGRELVDGLRESLGLSRTGSGH